jgi:putative sterol carrier protein
MPRYLSPEWVQAFNRALSGLDLTDAVAVAGRTSLAASEGAFAVAQVVDDAPEGTVRTVLTVEGGRAALALDLEGSVPANVTIVVGYDDALSIARGQLDPADALAAGRVRVRGELAVLVAGQAVLNEAATLLGSGLADLTD